MHRRRFLRQVGLGGACAVSVSLAGCSGGGRDTGQPAPGGDGDGNHEQTPHLAENVVVGDDWGHEMADAETLAVTLPLVNDGNSETTVSVLVQLTVDGEILSAEEELTISPGEEETVVFSFEVDGDVDESDSFGISIRIYQA